VHHLRDRARGQPGPGQEGSQPAGDAPDDVLRLRQHLLEADAAVVADEHEVDERSPHVDSEAHRRNLKRAGGAAKR